MRLPKNMALMFLLVTGLVTCKKPPAASTDAPAQKTVAQAGNTAAALQLVSKVRPDPAAIQLSDVSIEEFISGNEIENTLRAFYAPAISFTPSLPLPDYYTYTACPSDGSPCFEGQFSEPSQFLCNVSPGTYTFKDIKGCTETNIDGKAGGCSAAFNPAPNTPFVVKPATSQKLATLFAAECQHAEEMKQATTQLFKYLADPSKLSQSCTDGFSQMLDYGPISYAHMIYFYGTTPTPPPTAAEVAVGQDVPTPNSASTSTSTPTPPQSTARHPSDMVIGGVVVMLVGAGLIGAGAAYLFHLRSPYKLRTYKMGITGIEQQIGKTEIKTKKVFDTILGDRPPMTKTEEAYLQKRPTFMNKGSTFERVTVTEKKGVMADGRIVKETHGGFGAHEIEIHDRVNDKVQVYEGVDNVKLRRAGAVAAMFAGAGIIAVGGAMTGGAMGLADTSGTPSSDVDLNGPLAACVQDPNIENVLQQINSILAQRDAVESDISKELYGSSP